MKIKQKLIEFFSLDYRSLALMRVGMGVLIILDLIERASSLSAHYSDAGVLSRSNVLLHAGNTLFASVHMMSGLSIVQAILFLIAGIFAVLLILGYRTKLVTVVSWFLLISLHARNPMVLQGGDVIFRVVLFWMMFLPIGRVWSLDRILNRTSKASEKTFFGTATVAYVVQIVLVYVFAGVLKTGAPWYNGTAVYYALSVDQLTTHLGRIMRNWKQFDRIATFGTLYYEIYGSVLYFSPFKTGLFRTIGVLLFALMQIGFNSAFHLGIFGAIAIITSLGLLPSYFWDNWVARATATLRSRARPGLSMFYDTNCGFCFKMVHVLRRILFLSPQTLIAPASGENEKLMYAKNSWVVVDQNNNTYYGFQGLAIVCGYSPLFFWLRSIFLISFIRRIGEYCYSTVAEKRLLVCLPEKTESAPSSRKKQFAFVRDCIVIFLTIYIIVWNIDTARTKALVPHSLNWVAWATRLDQQFDMFAPAPLTEDGWIVIPAELQDGTKIDLFKNGPMLKNEINSSVSYEKPWNVAAKYPDQRWQKYMMNIAEANNMSYRLSYGQYLCRTWNAKHTDGKTLMSFKIMFMEEITPPPGKQQEPIKPIVLWNHHCF